MRWRSGTNGTDAHDEAGTESTLATIEEALEGGHANAMDPEDRRLQELALALQAEPQRPRTEYAQHLERQVASGFPREPHTRLGRLGGRLARLPGFVRRPSMPAIGAAASVLLVLVVAGTLVVQDGQAPNAPSATSLPVPEGNASGAAGDDTGVVPGDVGSSGRSSSQDGVSGAFVAPMKRGAGGREDGAINRDNRRVERAAQMTLAAPADDLQDVAAGISVAADRHRGVLLQSALTTGDEGSAGGRFELRLPVDELPSAIADLSELATVRTLTQTADDRTAGFLARDNEVDDARSRLDELQEELAAAATDEDRDAVRAEIVSTRERIRAAERALDRVRDRTSFATMSITLTEGEAEESGLGAALDDALGLFEDVLALAVRALGLLVPLALVAAAVWLAGRSLRRRRRESALA